MRYTIKQGSIEKIIQHGPTSVIEARKEAKILSLKNLGETVFIYQENAPGLQVKGYRRWRPYEAYLDGARKVLAHTEYPDLESNNWPTPDQIDLPESTTSAQEATIAIDEEDREYMIKIFRALGDRLQDLRLSNPAKNRFSQPQKDSLIHAIDKIQSRLNEIKSKIV